MNNANLYFFNLDDELLSEVKADINAALERILAGMSEKGVSDGEVSLSLKISLHDDEIVTADGELKDVLIPEIEHKVSTKMTVKESSKGAFSGYSVPGDAVLVLTRFNGQYAVVKSPMDASQLTLGGADDEVGYA